LGLALFSLPFELQPGGDPRNYNYYPYIGAGPEVEDLITRPIEEVLEKLKVENYQHSAGLSSITIEFSWGTC